jgi:hypothetical protein
MAPTEDSCKPDVSDVVSEPDYMVVAASSKGYRVRFKHEPDLQTPRLPPDVTEVTVRRDGITTVLHTKEVPSKVMAWAKERFK